MIRRVLALLGITIGQADRPSTIAPCPLCGSRDINAWCKPFECDDCGHRAHDESDDPLAQWNEEAKQR